MSLFRKLLACLVVLVGVAQAGVVPTRHVAVQRVIVRVPSIRVVVRPVQYVTRRVTVRVPYTYRAVTYRTTVKRYRRGGVLTVITRRTPVVTVKRGYRTQVRTLRVATRL